MEPIWNALPIELSEHICNQLPKVRWVAPGLKREIESQRWMLAKILDWYHEFAQYNSAQAYWMIKRDLGCTGDLNVHWSKMSPEERLTFYYSAGGPGSAEGLEKLQRERMFRNWLYN